MRIPVRGGAGHENGTLPCPVQGEEREQQGDGDGGREALDTGACGGALSSPFFQPGDDFASDLFHRFARRVELLPMVLAAKLVHIA